MSEERKERCETCRFWLDHRDKEIREGDCRRYPPDDGELEDINFVLRDILDHLANGDNAFVRSTNCRSAEDACARFPGTMDSDWCGEWQPKERP